MGHGIIVENDLLNFVMGFRSARTPLTNAARATVRHNKSLKRTQSVGAFTPQFHTHHW